MRASGTLKKTQTVLC